MADPEQAPASSAEEVVQEELGDWRNSDDLSFVDVPMIQDEGAKPAEASPAEETTDAKPAESSPVEGDTKPKSALEAVENALKPEAAKEPGESPAPEVDQDKPLETKTGEDADDDGKKDEDPPFHEHPRWQEMIAERDGLKADVERLEVDAGHFQNLQSFARDANLSQEDMTNGLNIMRLMRNDPVRCYSALQPYMTALEGAIGVTIPADLQEQVDRGMMTLEAAQLSSRDRAAARLADGRTVQSERTIANNTAIQRQEADDKAVDDYKLDVGNSMTSWEEKWKSSDPDYEKLQPFVQDKIVAKINAATTQLSVDDIVKIADDARVEVKKTMSALVPTKKPVEPVRAGKTVTDPATAPKDALDVVNQVLDGTYVNQHQA